jgi:hypothetical protein
MSRNLDLDRVGTLASTACAVHCAAIPILMGLGAAGAVSWFDHEPVEWGFVGLAAVVGTVSAWRGYRVHGNKVVALVLVVAALSLAALTWSRHGGEHDAHTGGMAWLFPVLGLVIAVSHVVNRRLCRACTACEAHQHVPATQRSR